MSNGQQFDDKNISVKSMKKKSKVSFWSLVCAVAFFLIGLIEVAFMEFFTVKFTVIFVSIMGSLTVLSLIVWLIKK